MQTGHGQEMKDLGDVIYAMELRYNEREKEAVQEIQSIMDELKNKVHNDYCMLSGPRCMDVYVRACMCVCVHA